MLNLQSVSLVLGLGGSEGAGMPRWSPRKVWGEGSDPRHASCLLCPARSPTLPGKPGAEVKERTGCTNDQNQHGFPTALHFLTSPWPWGYGDARTATSQRVPRSHSTMNQGTTEHPPLFLPPGGLPYKKTLFLSPALSARARPRWSLSFPPEKHQFRRAVVIHERVMLRGTGTSPPGGQAWLWAPSQQNISGRDLGVSCSEHLPPGSQRGMPGHSANQPRAAAARSSL